VKVLDEVVAVGEEFDVRGSEGCRDSGAARIMMRLWHH
jgi:hypothetical protein